LLLRSKHVYCHEGSQAVVGRPVGWGRAKTK